MTKIVEMADNMSNEEKRPEQLMLFMTNFKTSMEKNMTIANNKIDKKIDRICEDMKEMNGKIENNENKSVVVLERMDQRLEPSENGTRAGNANFKGQT